MRLIMLAGALGPSAGEQGARVLELARAFAAHGVQLTVAAGRLDGPAPELDVSVLGAEGARLAAAAFRFILRRSGSFDAVWCPAGCAAAGAAALAAWWNDAPAVLRFGGGHEDVKGFWRVWALRRAARLGPWIVADDIPLARRLLGNTRLRYWELGQGVDVSRFSPIGESERAVRRAQLGLGPGPVFACPSPGGEPARALMSAWTAVAGPGATLALAGPGPTEDTYPAGVRFIGKTHDLYKLYQASDAAVFPPGTAASAVLEAMAAGLAVLAPGDREIIELIEEGRSGYSYEPGQPRLLENKLREMLSKPSRLAVVGREARASVLKSRAFDRIAQRYLEIFETRNARGRVLPRTTY